MEETPDSGLTEEIQRSQIDLGAIIWGPDASTDSVSQKITQDGSQEDSACLSEAEQGPGIVHQNASFCWLGTVAGQGENVLGPAPPRGDEQLPPNPMPGAACMEMEHPCDLPDSEIPAMETSGLVKESQEDVKSQKKRKETRRLKILSGQVWRHEKVEAGTIGVKDLEGTEEFEERTCGSRGNRVVDLLRH